MNRSRWRWPLVVPGLLGALVLTVCVHDRQIELVRRENDRRQLAVDRFSMELKVAAPDSDLCDWQQCDRAYEIPYEAGATTLNPERGIKLCAGCELIVLEWLDRERMARYANRLRPPTAIFLAPSRKDASRARGGG